MKFGFNFGFLGGSKGVGAEACIGNAQTDTTWNGHIAGTGSTLKPVETVSELIGYELKWDALDISGNVELALGVAGDEQEPNANDIAIAKDGRGVLLSWDDTAKRYVGSDLVFTTYLNTKFIVGGEVCVVVGFLPIKLEHLDFEKIETGVKI